MIYRITRHLVYNATRGASSTVFPHRESNDNRYNPVGIQMLPDGLYRQIFGNNIVSNNYNYNVRRSLEHLERHQLLPRNSQIESQENIVMELPKLQGLNIDDHFNSIGRIFSLKYKEMAQDLIASANKVLSTMPSSWIFEPGWTRYEPTESGSFLISRVNYPLEDTIIFDVETCLNDTKKNTPTLAVAASTKAWYSWTSPRLTHVSKDVDEDHATLGDLIPFKPLSVKESLIVGHNVGFDRSFISNQYELNEDKTKFLDTLSLHMCICGLTGLQRAYKCAQKRKQEDGEYPDESDIENSGWIQESCLNNLADVYEFHCGKKITKDDREIFIEGSMNDVRQNYQSLVTYCANDVKATFEVFKKLFGTFSERFPHPVTLAGMLEMSTMYLPVDVKNWYKYTERSQEIYDSSERKLSLALQNLADEACSKTKQEISKDVWLWDLDITKQSITPNKTKLTAWAKQQVKNPASSVDDCLKRIYDTKEFMRQIIPFKPGFPKWYRDLCCPPDKAAAILRDKEWGPGPILISPQMRITPKLMQLTWDGYPLHFHQNYGWGYLVPNDDLVSQYADKPENSTYKDFPIKELKDLCKNLPRSNVLVEEETDEDLTHDFINKRIDEIKDTQIGTVNFLKLLKKMSKKKKIIPRLKGQYCPEVEIPGAYFIRLPHKNGPGFNVGNPLGKDFVAKMEDGTLSSFDNDLANILLRHSSSLSYWKNNKSRIKQQMVIPLGTNLDDTRAAILPRVIVSGTVTRRAVEPTWLTASNQDTSRVGSELKAMVQAPNGYCFVGADVDSQELWIASLMGDSYSYKIHGGTGLSYMTLRGNKSDKTDMHSKTASLIGITRDDAKVLNYARIYGAGQKFIERFLLNTNPHLNVDEAKEKARTIFKETKGVRKFFYVKSDINNKQVASRDASISIPVKISKHERLQFLKEELPFEYDNERQQLIKEAEQKRDLKMFWDGGTESATFNKLEEIASSPEPRTPVLNCQISKALEPAQDISRDFVTSRVNWVVQSSAVDFLHLLLVNMKWLFRELKIDGRFSISIHDEVRYIVKSEDKYKAAFALQISNLMVRSYFAYKLNMRDLPISVAFFSSVDIDKCLRKEVTMDCKSPSNPHGLHKAYGIPKGESLDIKKIIEKYTYKVVV